MIENLDKPDPETGYNMRKPQFSPLINLSLLRLHDMHVARQIGTERSAVLASL